MGRIRLRFGEPGSGITGWRLRGAADGDVDGLRTLASEEPEPPEPAAGPYAAVDHVVASTPDFDRTRRALAAAGFEERRVREAGAGARQAFYVVGDALLELAGPAVADGDGPAAFWGLVLVVADLDEAAARLGDLAGAPRDAVQAGRRIVTLRREVRLGQAAQLGQRAVLDAAHALDAEAEAARDLLGAALAGAVEAEPQLDHLALQARQVLQRRGERLVAQAAAGVVERVGRALVLQQLTQLAILVGAHRRVQRDRHAVEPAEILDHLEGQREDLRELLVARRGAGLRLDLALGLLDLLDVGRDIDRQAHQPRLLVDRAAQRLLDPQRRVGRELEALAVVELLGRAHEADGPLLDEVEEGEALALVALGDRDHQPQIGAHHALLGDQVAALDALGQLDLVLPREQGRASDVLEEAAEDDAVFLLAMSCRRGHGHREPGQCQRRFSASSRQDERSAGVPHDAGLW